MDGRVSDLELQVAAEQGCVGLERFREVVAVLRETFLLAAVAHEGDPWYAEHDGIDGDGIIARARQTLNKIEPLAPKEDG